MGKTNWAGKVAAICNVDESKASVSLMARAEATIVGASIYGFGTRVVEAKTIVGKFKRPMKFFYTRPVNVLIFAVLCTSLPDHYLAIFVVDGGFDDFEALRTNTSSSVGQGFLLHFFHGYYHSVVVNYSFSVQFGLKGFSENSE